MGVSSIRLFWWGVASNFVYNGLGNRGEISLWRNLSLPCLRSAVNKNFFQTEPLPKGVMMPWHTK